MMLRTILLCLFGASIAQAQGTTFSGVLLSGVVDAPAQQQQASCTDGVDCYCDTAAYTGDSLKLACADFEDVSFYEYVEGWYGDGVTTYEGYWDRGADSDWRYAFPEPTFQDIFEWADGTPYLGSRCEYGSGSPGGYQGCSGQREYCSAAQGALTPHGGADCWGPNVNATSSLDIQRSGDFDAEVGTLTLTGGKGVTADIGAGRQHMAFRINTNSAGEQGLGKMLFTSKTEVGITMAVAYASNIVASHVRGAPWKHEEWSGGGAEEHWNMGMTGAGGEGIDASFPYQGMFWVKQCYNYDCEPVDPPNSGPIPAGTKLSLCAAVIQNATALVGSIGCSDDGVGLGWSAYGGEYPTWITTQYYLNSGQTNYVQETDFPFGTWGCHRAHITDRGGSNGTLQVWHNNEIVVHITGLNFGTNLDNRSYSHMWWNGYSNQANGAGTDEVTYRYRDNVHIRNGSPVSCETIGFN